MKKNEFNITGMYKFTKLNKKQKKNILLKSASALVLAEASACFLASGIATTVNTDYSIIVPALFYLETLISAGMSAMCGIDAVKDNNTNNKMVNNYVKNLSDKLYDNENIVLSRK